VRAQAAKVLGDLETPAALVALLDDENPRVRYFALIGVSKGNHFGDARPMFDRIVEIAAENCDQDPVLRHGVVLALASTRNLQRISDLSKHDSLAVRRAAVVALRRLKSPSIVRFLHDGDESVVLEAARAIHDLPIQAAMPQLAGLIARGLQDDALLRRVLNANFRLGDAESAAALAQYAAQQSSPEAMRHEALSMLENWAEPAPLDRVLNFYRPLETRDPQIAKTALVAQLPGLLAAPEKVRVAAAQLAAQLGVQEVAPVLVELMNDADQTPQARADALTAVVALGGDVQAVVADALTSDLPALRAAARTLLTKVAPDEAIARLAEGAKADTKVERQQALADLAASDLAGADQIIAERLAALTEGNVALDTQLDVLQAAEAKRDNPALHDLLTKYEATLDPADPLAAYRPAIVGGDVAAGRKIFFEKTEVSCVRCHRAQGVGGRVGPELDKIGAEKEPAYLLEAIVRPNAKIAKGFESVMVLSLDGRTHTGVLKAETDESLSLVNAEGELVTLAQDDIEARKAANSPMPEDIYKHLTRREIRDLVAFLSSLRRGAKSAGHE
ncbi:MAG: glucose dehydrogenase, partial [Blastopirellula sp. JB062]